MNARFENKNLSILPYIKRTTLPTYLKPLPSTCGPRRYLQWSQRLHPIVASKQFVALPVPVLATTAAPILTSIQTVSTIVLVEDVRLNIEDTVTSVASI